MCDIIISFITYIGKWSPDIAKWYEKCRLCKREKYYILFEPDGATLNKRSELYNTCRHRLKDLLNNI